MGRAMGDKMLWRMAGQAGGDATMEMASEGERARVCGRTTPTLPTTTGEDDDDDDDAGRYGRSGRGR